VGDELPLKKNSLAEPLRLQAAEGRLRFSRKQFWQRLGLMEEEADAALHPPCWPNCCPCPSRSSLASRKLIIPVRAQLPYFISGVATARQLAAMLAAGPHPTRSGETPRWPVTYRMSNALAQLSVIAGQQLLLRREKG
jgi:hypothetical protein